MSNNIDFYMLDIASGEGQEPTLVMRTLSTEIASYRHGCNTKNDRKGVAREWRLSCIEGKWHAGSCDKAAVELARLC
eukprot:365890-Chlamydomonas_euryale.AAC.5